MKDLSVALVQDVIDWQNPPANRERYQRYIDEIKQDIDLLVLPEMFSTGFYLHPGEKYETMDGDTVQWMSGNATNLNATITGSLIMRDQGRFVNRMIWSLPDGRIKWYDKRHLFRFGGEHHHFTAGNQRTVFDCAGWRVALFVCYDLRFPVWSRNVDDYDLALYVANWPDVRQYAWDTLLRARAIENQSYVIGVNRLGENPLGDTFSGGSAILDFMGEAIEDGRNRPGVFAASLSLSALEKFKDYFPASLDRDRFSILGNSEPIDR